MTHEDFFETIGALLGPIGCSADDGEDYREPPLEVLRFEVRLARLHWIPVLGRALSVVAIARQPEDVSGDTAGYRRLLDRLARAVHGRYPPWPRGGPGLVIGMTAVTLTDEPIGPDDEESLGRALSVDRRSRVVPLGFLRINLDQEAMAFALGRGPRDVFPEPITLADGLSDVFGRYVPPLELG